MATRPVFLSSSSGPLWHEMSIDFEWFPGFSGTQKRRCIASLHDSFTLIDPHRRVLEISGMSETDLGRSLSAFSLEIVRTDVSVSVEAAFQGSKVFQKAGPFTEIYTMGSKEAKQHPGLKSSGSLMAFDFFGQLFPLEPKTFFYDWIYITALAKKQDLCDALVGFDAFTDIAFNPKKSLNCQARSVAIYVSLQSRGLLDQALNSPSEFKNLVYPALKTT